MNTQDRKIVVDEFGAGAQSNDDQKVGLGVHKRISVNKKRQTSPDPISRTAVKSTLRSKELPSTSAFSVQPKNEKRRRYIPNQLFQEEKEETYEEPGHEYLTSANVKKPRSFTAHAANARIRDNAINQNFSQVMRYQDSNNQFK